VVVGHAEVVGIANSPVAFSNSVSRHLQIPNGLDGERHIEARRLLAPFFHPPALDALEPALSRIAAGVIADRGERTFDAVEDLGVVYAVRAASAWLGWRDDLEAELIAWVAEHRAAGRSGQPERLAHAAARFDALVRGLILERRRRRACDLTGLLMTVRWEGRLITDAEVVSILRNWTGGDLSSLALCVGVVLHWVAAHPDHILHLSESDDVALDRAIDEMLRLDDPSCRTVVSRCATRSLPAAQCASERRSFSTGEQPIATARCSAIPNRSTPTVTAEPMSSTASGHTSARAEDSRHGNCASCCARSSRRGDPNWSPTNRLCARMRLPPASARCRCVSPKSRPSTAAEVCAASEGPEAVRSQTRMLRRSSCT
jgi:hypothetical protein